MDFQVNPFLDAIMLVMALALAVYNYKRALLNNTYYNGSGYFALFVLMVLFALYYRPPQDDFWHYLDGYKQGRGLYGNNMEDVYYWLMDIIPNNYLLWRLAIWGPTAVLIIMTFKKLDIPSGIATIFFICFALANTYYYTRNALALSLLYLGVAFFVKDERPLKIKKWLPFLVLGAVSWYFHKSMPLYIFAVVVAMFVPYNKKVITISVFSFLVLYGLVYTLSEGILDFGIWIDNGSKGEYYLEQENFSNANWIGKIAQIIKYVPTFYFLWIASLDYFTSKEKYGEDAYPYKVFLFSTIIIVFISFLFIGQGSSALHGRIYKSCLTPFAFSACYYFMKNWRSQQCVNFTILFIIAKGWFYVEGYFIHPYLW